MMLGKLGKETLSALATFFGFTLIVPVFLLFRSKDDDVRFWAAQSLVFFVFVFLIDWLVLLIRVFNFLPSLIFVVTMVFWLTMVYRSWLGEIWKIPVLGKVAEKLLAKI